MGFVRPHRFPESAAKGWALEIAPSLVSVFATLLLSQRVGGLEVDPEMGLLLTQFSQAGTSRNAEDATGLSELEMSVLVKGREVIEEICDREAPKPLRLASCLALS